MYKILFIFIKTLKMLIKKSLMNVIVIECDARSAVKIWITLHKIFLSQSTIFHNLVLYFIYNFWCFELLGVDCQDLFDHILTLTVASKGKEFSYTFNNRSLIYFGFTSSNSKNLITAPYFIFSILKKLHVYFEQL